MAAALPVADADGSAGQAAGTDAIPRQQRTGAAEAQTSPLSPASFPPSFPPSAPHPCRGLARPQRSPCQGRLPRCWSGWGNARAGHPVPAGQGVRGSAGRRVCTWLPPPSYHVRLWGWFAWKKPKCFFQVSVLADPRGRVALAHGVCRYRPAAL